MRIQGALTIHTCQECQLVQRLCKSVLWFLIKLKADLPYDPATPLLGVYPADTKLPHHRDICPPMFTAGLFTIAQLWNQPKCQSTPGSR